MERFLKRHQGRVTGSITGFDRLLFRGILRSICYVEGLNYFMGNQRVPFKGFKAFVEKFSAGVRKRAEEIAKRAGRPLIYLSASRTEKEKLVREVMERDRIEEGLICVLACVEPCPSFSVRPNREKRELQLVARERKCLHLYFYLLNRDFGLMHIRGWRRHRSLCRRYRAGEALFLITFRPPLESPFCCCDVVSKRHELGPQRVAS